MPNFKAIYIGFVYAKHYNGVLDVTSFAARLMDIGVCININRNFLLKANIWKKWVSWREMHTTFMELLQLLRESYPTIYMFLGLLFASWWLVMEKFFGSSWSHVHNHFLMDNKAESQGYIYPWLLDSTNLQLLGVTVQAEKDEIVKAVMELKNSTIEDGYTAETIVSRKVQDSVLHYMYYCVISECCICRISWWM